jgi:hypothetical protein
MTDEFVLNQIYILTTRIPETGEKFYPWNRYSMNCV